MNDEKIYFIEIQSDTSNYGGTFTLYLTNSLIKATSFQSNQSTVTNTTTNHQIILHGCFLYESMNYKKCQKGYELITKTDINNNLHNIMLNVAYPMIGKWYLALWKECFDRDTK